MRALLPIVLIAVGCAATAKEQEEIDWPMPKGYKLPPKSMWGGRRQHPVGGIELGGGTGEMTYQTSGTANPRDDTARANIYRFSYRGRGGLDVDLFDTVESFQDGTSARGIDAFSYMNLPLWPNNRLRLMSRPGGFFYAMNLKGTRPGDVEPWSLGLRYELEAEVDVIKTQAFLLSLFAAGNIGWGWGNAKTQGTKVNITMFPFGWEAGLRAHLHRWYFALTWIDQTTEIEDFGLFNRAEYRYQGGTLMLGFRW